MDSFRELAADLEPAFGSHAPEPIEADPSGDERRMQVRAYNYWASLLAGRDFPSIEDLEPSSIADFARSSVLLDFTAGPANPTTAYVGEAVRRECDLDPEVESMAEVPAGSLLARLADYYEQIIDSRAPVGVEADVVNQRGHTRCYRGILMPFSSDGDTIDFVYGVFNWTGSDAAAQPMVAAEPRKAKMPLNLDMPAAEHIPWEDGPLADAREASDDADALVLEEPANEPLELVDAASEPEPLELMEPAVAESSAEPVAAEPQAEAPVAAVDDLAEWLEAARAIAEHAKLADGRSRQALYEALAQAYDFACAAVDSPAQYEALLAQAAIVVQARAPMTAVAKLVFGSDYDKARLTEYAAALSYAARQRIGPGGFLSFIEEQPGGLKGLVEAERRVRRPEGAADSSQERAYAVLRTARPRPLDAFAGNGEFALVLVRRDPDGQVSPVAGVSDPVLLDRAIRRAAA